MSRLEDFLKKSKPKNAVVNTELMEFSNKRYQCQKCDEWSNGSFFDSREMTIYWDCPQGHQSKVQISV